MHHSHSKNTKGKNLEKVLNLSERFIRRLRIRPKTLEKIQFLLTNPLWRIFRITIFVVIELLISSRPLFVIILKHRSSLIRRNLKNASHL